MTKTKQEFKKAGFFTYSQFIEVDVNSENKPAKWVRACKEKDFNKWVLKKKNIQIYPIDYMRCNSKILEFLKEYLQMNLFGWRIPAILVKNNEVLIKTETEEFILK